MVNVSDNREHTVMCVCVCVRTQMLCMVRSALHLSLMCRWCVKMKASCCVTKTTCCLSFWLTSVHATGLTVPSVHQYNMSSPEGNISSAPGQHVYYWREHVWYIPSHQVAPVLPVAGSSAVVLLVHDDGREVDELRLLSVRSVWTSGVQQQKRWLIPLS